MVEADPAGLLNGSWWWANGNGIQIPSNAPALISSDGLISTREQLRDQIQGLVIAPSTHVLVDDPHPSPGFRKDVTPLIHPSGGLRT